MSLLRAATAAARRAVLSRPSVATTTTAASHGRRTMSTSFSSSAWKDRMEGTWIIYAYMCYGAVSYVIDHKIDRLRTDHDRVMRIIWEETRSLQRSNAELAALVQNHTSNLMHDQPSGSASMDTVTE